ncbi:hypothetical protein H4696_007644 [Amycolatopsis lexingtonensis]|uniref:DUF742 domain-containing protein n=1 Tax=Amycolatopsis lexingtonensis TaxID=218822 RepID=A0ABR9IBH9_9PSEU|nr:DUF742 domain-containing protein [Amycolatopsis lexingtonensis]MBE1500544.1 hypothetical protein [Amycolatopsis lexingtonensis]
MRISGFDDPDSSGWDALHRGTEREGFDSPSKFDMSTLSMIMPKRKPSRPKPDPQGYTDEDTREWGSSSDDEEYTGGHRRHVADDYPPAPPREFAGYADAHSPQYAEDGYDPAEPEWQDGETYAPEPPALEPAWTPPRGARPPAPPRPPVAHRPPAPRPPAPRHPVAPPPSWTPPPDPETRWIPQPEPWEDPAWHEPARVASPVPVASANSRVRPYTRTGGRTRSDHNLALEALVSTSDDGRRYRGVRSVEHRRICDLCLDTRSVAEIAAHLRLPLGVVKILVGDMADIGLVLIHQTELILGDRSSRDFMERVLAGLRAL